MQGLSGVQSVLQLPTHPQAMNSSSLTQAKVNFIKVTTLIKLEIFLHSYHSHNDLYLYL